MTGNKMGPRVAWSLLAASIALILGGNTADASVISTRPRYMLTDLGTLPGNDSSYAVDINNAGQVVGGSLSTAGAHGPDRAFVYSDGRMTALDSLQPPGFSDKPINETGQIIGRPRGTDQSHIYRVGSSGIVDEGQVFVAAQPVAINDKGQVAGHNNGPDGFRSFLHSNGATTNLGTLGMGVGRTGVLVSDLNNSGQMVGRHMYEVGSDHALRYAPFLYSGGELIDLGRFGLEGSTANAINDVGQVVGGWFLGPDSHAFLYDDGMVIDLGTLGGSLSAASDINVLGQIVGYSSKKKPGGAFVPSCMKGERCST